MTHDVDPFLIADDAPAELGRRLDLIDRGE